MKASDTVMSDEQIQELDGRWMLPCTDYDRQVAKAQAEVSFKAGYEEAVAECLGDMAYDQIKQAGIKEVIEWISSMVRTHETIRQFHYNPDSITLRGAFKPIIFIDEWQSKLEEWGYIEEH